MKNLTTLFTVLESGDVERFHTVPNVMNQKVRDHSWGVSVICQYISSDCSKELLLAAMFHDCAELETGDIPATAKWSNPIIKELFDELESKLEKQLGIYYELDEHDYTVLKIADTLEGMLYCNNRLECGEINAIAPFSKWLSFFDSSMETKWRFILTEEEKHKADSLYLRMKEIVNGYQ